MTTNNTNNDDYNNTDNNIIIINIGKTLVLVVRNEINRISIKKDNKNLEPTVDFFLLIGSFLKGPKGFFFFFFF